ncbi:MAG TPA: hypothetical protein VN808_19560 [Stellaceae bacterium]|nr:hypothetical protein [Stellaceae bacterium]
MNSTISVRAFRAAVVGGLIALAAGAIPTNAATPDQAPSLAPGQSRVWFLRQLLPGTQFHPPMIYVNGAPIAASAEGTAFYRDFAPGQYAFTVENCLPQARTGQTMTLGPNTQFALEVTSDENGAWDCIPNQISYLRQVQPQNVPYLFSQVNYLGAR